MARYIDADAYKKYLDENWVPANYDAIDAQPTADVAPVIHAHWIFIGDESPLYTHKCSNCGGGKLFHSAIEMRIKNEFCSYCGAWMYGE